MKSTKTHELSKRLLFTILILAIYMAGRSLLLFNVDASAYDITKLDSQNLIYSMIGGDRYRYTVFALGIMPFITSSLLVGIVFAILGNEFKSQISPVKRERITLTVFLVFTVILTVSRVNDLVFLPTVYDIRIVKLIAAAELIIGALVLYKMAGMNKEHGIGGQSILILVNIATGLFSTIRSNEPSVLLKPLLLAGVYALILMVMEHITMKMPVQRVSIHNIYSDKNYIAFKLNPIGVMPVMFAVSFFMLPQLIIRFLVFLFEENQLLQSLNTRMDLNHPIGIRVYLLIILLLDVIFSHIMLSPSEMAEGLQKGGDSIVGVYAGRKTEKYLNRRLFFLSLISGLSLAGLMMIPLTLSIRGDIPAELALLPATGMMLSGLICNLIEEINVYRKFDKYPFFI